MFSLVRSLMVLYFSEVCSVTKQKRGLTQLEHAGFDGLGDAGVGPRRHVAQAVAQRMVHAHAVQHRADVPLAAAALGEAQADEHGGAGGPLVDERIHGPAARILHDDRAQPGELAVVQQVTAAVEESRALDPNSLTSFTATCSASME